MTPSRLVWQLMGETVREIGVLGLVFAPLESIFSGRSLDPRLLALTLAATALMIVCGILAEVRGRCV